MVKNGDHIFVLGKLCFDFCLIKVFNFNLLSFCFKIIEFIYFGHLLNFSSLKEGFKLKQNIAHQRMSAMVFRVIPSLPHDKW